MNDQDLAALDQLLATAWAVVSMREIHAGNVDKAVIGLRHDVDDNGWPAALGIARWEADRGYRSTYFLLHTAPYFTDTLYFRQGLEEIAVLGHEIGFHANGIAEALRTNGNPHEIVADALALLRSWGHPIRGVVAHGDELCHSAHFVNDEQFSECARSAYGAPDREVSHDGNTLKLNPLPLDTFGFDYDSNHLSRSAYLSDSGGEWCVPGFDVMTSGFPFPNGQLHILQHPDWWADAFAPEQVEAAA